MTTLLTLLLLAATLLPISKALYTKLSGDAATTRYELLLKVVGDAVSHVQQVSADNEMESEEKKELATTLATKIAGNLGIHSTKFELIGDLIESHLWHEEQDEEDDDFE